jgi:hypothetical protein
VAYFNKYRSRNLGCSVSNGRADQWLVKGGAELGGDIRAMKRGRCGPKYGWIQGLE